MDRKSEKPNWTFNKANQQKLFSCLHTFRLKLHGIDWTLLLSPDLPKYTDVRKQVSYSIIMSSISICSAIFCGIPDLFLIKNPAYGRHWISWPMRIVRPIQFWINFKFFFWRGCQIWLYKKNKYKNWFFLASRFCLKTEVGWFFSFFFSSLKDCVIFLFFSIDLEKKK